MAKKPLYFEIFTTSLGSLLLEISYTRIFSFKVFYYFTYLILGVGLLGIGSGGIALATSERLRRADPLKLIPGASFVGGASVLVGYLVIAPMQINIADGLTAPPEIAKLVFVSLLLTASFFCVGIVISAILSSDAHSANRLYGADLLGAALGCTLAVPLIATLTPPRTIMLAGLVLSAGGLRLARGSRDFFIAGVATTIALAVPTVTGRPLQDPVVARSKAFEDYRQSGAVRFSKWSPVFRIDVADHPFFPGDLFLVFHDGQPGSGLRQFDGTFKKFGYLETDPRALPFEVLPPSPRVLIIGAAGGHEIVSSLYFKAEHVTGVELNPVTYSLLTDVFADITGHLPENPKVTLLNGDGRWFLKQAKDKYDLIWFVAPDSYAAMNAATSGAFVLSESYLYTVEMVRQSLEHLTDRGIVCTQFGELAYDKKPNRTTRYLATARAAFAEEGMDDFSRHVLVSSAAGYPPFLESAVLLGKKPFEPEQIARFVGRTERIKGGIVRYVPGRTPDQTPVNKVIAMSKAELPGFFERHPYQVDPVRDDAPFFWHFARFTDAMAAPLPGGGLIIDYEDSIAEQVTLGFFFIVVALAAVLLLLPLFTIRSVWSEMPHKSSALTYFGALGLGFMFIEVALIQKLTLLVGYPTYSLSVTLFALLLSSGAGSLLSARFGQERNRFLFGAVSVLVAVVVLFEVVQPAIVDHFVGSALPVRIAVTVFLVAPIGLCLGSFMPLGLRTVAATTPHAREYVAWAWAVNGFFSVIASILATILAMVIGFRELMLLALLVYVAGAFALARVPESKTRPA
jgi:predicted membrane-bound spermidine synthase